MKKYFSVLLCFAVLVVSALSFGGFSFAAAEGADSFVFSAENIISAPDMSVAITEEAWGKATVSIDKNTYNTGLTKYNGDPEDVSADMYFHWDSENLYIGVKTPDSDVTGWSQNYVGDGLQFKLQAGDAITSEAADICLTWGKNGFDATVGGESFKVRGSGDNIEALNQNTRFNIINEDGSLSIMLAIRHTDMGYTADEIKAGATYAMSMLRISGRGGENASEEQAYSGWLDWGRYWDESSSLYNANCVSNSVIVLGEQETAPANMFEAEKTLGAISTDGAITEEAWGKATVSIDKNTYNTGLTKYNGDPEDVSADMYFRWDSENLYIGVKTPDSDVTGWSQNYVGDGLQFKLQAGDAITSEAADICLTWGKNGFDATVGGESFKVRGSGDNIEALNQNTRFNIVNEDGSMSIMLAIRHTDMGYTADEIKAGATYAMSMLRISGRGGDNASEEQAYSGWLDWGRYWDESSSLYNANCVSNSVIVLHEKDGAASSNAEADYESALIDITAAVGGSVSKAGFGDGMKVVSTDFGSYVVYMTNSGIFDSTANGYNALNEFVLFEIGEDTVAQLGMFYTRTGDVDILSANDGTVYIVGGSSSHVIKELAVHGYDSSLESAVVNIWKYTESNGAVNGRTTQIPFESSKGYEYINTVMSNDGTKIYTFFASGSSLAWSVYDTASQVWDAEMHYASLTGSIDKSFAFGTSDGILFVYASGSSIYTLDIQNNSASTIVSDSASELKDAYIDANGQLRLLYAATDGKVYLFGTDTVEVADMTASDYGRICSDANGAVSVLAMESGKPASVKVISENLLVNTIVLDSRAAASAAPIIAAPRNGSNADGSVKIVFPAPYRTGNHWYYAELTLN